MKIKRNPRSHSAPWKSCASAPRKASGIHTGFSPAMRRIPKLCGSLPFCFAYARANKMFNEWCIQTANCPLGTMRVNACSQGLTGYNPRHAKFGAALFVSCHAYTRWLYRSGKYWILSITALCLLERSVLECFCVCAASRPLHRYRIGAC